MPGVGFRHDSSVGVLATFSTDHADRCRSHPDLGAIRDQPLPLRTVPCVQHAHLRQGQGPATGRTLYSGDFCVHSQPSRLSPQTQGAAQGSFPEAGSPGHVADGPLSSGFQGSRARKLIRGQFPKLLLLTAPWVFHSQGSSFGQ